MTQPNQPPADSAKPAAPAAKPAMTDVEIRLQCIDLAVKSSAQSTVPISEKDITQSAREFYNFIVESNGSNDSITY